MYVLEQSLNEFSEKILWKQSILVSMLSLSFQKIAEYFYNDFLNIDIENEILNELIFEHFWLKNALHIQKLCLYWKNLTATIVMSWLNSETLWDWDWEHGRFSWVKCTKSIMAKAKSTLWKVIRDQWFLIAFPYFLYNFCNEIVPWKLKIWSLYVFDLW